MKRQIISRAFYGWLAYCRHLSTVRTHLSGLVNGRITPDIGAEEGLTEKRWKSLHNENGVVQDDNEVYRLAYFGGVEHNIRKEVWPYLLGHHLFGSTPQERHELNESTKHYYETTMSEWLAVEAIVRQRDKEKTAHAVAKLSSGGSGSQSGEKVNGKEIVVDVDTEMENEVFEENGFSDLSDPEIDDDDKGENEKNVEEEMEKKEETVKVEKKEIEEIKQEVETPNQDIEKAGSPSSNSSYETVANDFVEYEISSPNQPLSPKLTAVIVTDASIDIANLPNLQEDKPKSDLEAVEEDPGNSLDALQEPKSNCASPASSNGGIYSVSYYIFIKTCIEITLSPNF